VFCQNVLPLAEAQTIFVYEESLAYGDYTEASLIYLTMTSSNARGISSPSKMIYVRAHDGRHMIRYIAITVLQKIYVITDDTDPPNGCTKLCAGVPLRLDRCLARGGVARIYFGRYEFKSVSNAPSVCLLPRFVACLGRARFVPMVGLRVVVPALYDRSHRKFVVTSSDYLSSVRGLKLMMKNSMTR